MSVVKNYSPSCKRCEKICQNMNGTSNGYSPSKNDSPVSAFATGGGFMCLEHTFPGDIYENSYEIIEESAQYVMERTKHVPRVGIICGSGLGGLGDQLEDRDNFLYKDIPNFPISTVPGHAGKLVVGLLNEVPVICMQGRFHSYEGYALWKCAMPVRVMKLMGVEKLIVTNAAGGINPDYAIGDIMIIKDHVNMQGLAGDSPLRGRNDERFGVRFPAMSNSYTRIYRKKAKEIAVKLGISDCVKEGVYVMCGGPAYETIAEIRMLRVMGVDAVGMSTVPEVLVAKHCGMETFAFSLITNICNIDYDVENEANHEEVIEVANKRKKDLQELVKQMVSEMAKVP